MKVFTHLSRSISYPSKRTGLLSDVRTACQSMSTDTNTRSEENLLPFEKIPEPKSLPLIGTALDYTPFRGFDIKRVHEHWAKRHQEYGDIYKEKMPGTNYFVFCRTKEDTERLFRMEGRLPNRMYMKSITTVKTMMGYPDSIGNETGERWLRLRQPVNKLLLKKPSVWRHAAEQQGVCKEAVEYIIKHRDEKLEVPGFADFLHAWAFEMAGTFIFSYRFGLLRENPSFELKEAFEGSQKAMEFIGASFVSGPWKYRAMFGLKRSLLHLQDVLISIVEQQKLMENLKGSLLHEVLNLKAFSKIEKESLLMDILLGAVETTANTMTLCLYCLTMSSRVQERLRDEIMSLTPEQRASGRAIDSMKYLNAFFKEAHRLLPFTHSLPRLFDHDVVLSGYNIPAGTHIINTINSTFNMNPEYFENPGECLPERWMDNKSSSKFRTIGPFGIGGRACPGRSFAKQEILLFLTEILSRLEVQYHHEPATSISKATGALSTEPKFSFVSID